MSEITAEKRIALLGIIVSDGGAVEEVNSILHDFAHIVVGRMGLPIRSRGISAISVVLDATTDDVNALTGKLGRIRGVSSKAMFEKA